MSWWLADGEERAAKFPDRFEMPERKLRDVLDKRGPDKVLAKLMFETDEPCKEGPFKGAIAERMWVIVKGRGKDKRYLGELNNKPHFIKGLELGQALEFEPENVIGVALTPEGEEEQRDAVDN